MAKAEAKLKSKKLTAEHKKAQLAKIIESQKHIPEFFKQAFTNVVPNFLQQFMGVQAAPTQQQVPVPAQN